LDTSAVGGFQLDLGVKLGVFYCIVAVCVGSTVTRQSGCRLIGFQFGIFLNLKALVEPLIVLKYRDINIPLR